MKTLGLIGGTTWLSTVEYYRLLNELTNKRIGGSSSCRCLLYSVNFADIRRLVDADDWDGVAALVSEACTSLQAGGAEAIMLCANTLHLVADKIETQLQVPLIDLRDATGLAIQLAGLSRVALLGTRFTMERGFFEDRLADYQIDTIVPNAADRTFVDDSIFNELASNVLTPATRTRYVEIIARLASQGAEGVILGCTEIPLLIKQADSPIPVFDTTVIHAEAAIDFSLAD